MTAENWLRRASGLVVPVRSFADHKLGRWQPCVGPCCECANCVECYGGTPPSTLWADIPALNDGLCPSPDCADIEQTVQVTRTVPDPYVGVCEWKKSAIVIPGTCAYGVAHLTIWLAIYTENVCQLSAELYIPSGFGGGDLIFWADDTLSCGLGPINHTLPSNGGNSAACNGTGTTFDVYE